MSMMSISDFESSDGLAKRFAALATNYLDQPDTARTAAAKIPLENLFRMLQMYRYDAFSDEARGGVLAFEGFGRVTAQVANSGPWHEKIKTAMSTAISESFKDSPLEQAIGQIQATLTWLATDTNPPPVEVRAQSKTFLEQFRLAQG
jgi:hypothetical protein